MKITFDVDFCRMDNKRTFPTDKQQKMGKEISLFLCAFYQIRSCDDDAKQILTINARLAINQKWAKHKK